MSSAGISFQSKPGGLKLTVVIGQWNFSAPTNRLDLHMYLNYTSPVTSLSQDNTTTTTDLSVFDIFTSGVQLTTTLTLLNKAEVDGVATSISYELNPQGSSVDLLLHFPHHTTTLLYDPDFSLLLSTDSTGNGDDTSSDDNTMLALVALVAVVPACACVVVVVGTVWYVAVRLRRSRLRGQAEQGNDVVNF